MEIPKTVMTIIAAVLIFSVGSLVVLAVANSDSRPEYVSAISVYINADGTDATHIQGALYSENGALRSTTNQYELVEDSWNVLYFPNPVRVDTKDSNYILTVQGDGSISIPSTGSGYISEPATYGNFPGTINNLTSTSDLSIYAIYQ